MGRTDVVLALLLQRKSRAESADKRSPLFNNTAGLRLIVNQQREERAGDGLGARLQVRELFGGMRRLGFMARREPYMFVCAVCLSQMLDGMVRRLGV